jgi:hypothetical protein
VSNETDRWKNRSSRLRYALLDVGKLLDEGDAVAARGRITAALEYEREMNGIEVGDTGRERASR